MSAAKFTPGPWDNDRSIKVRGLNFLSHCHYETEEGRANAHLIAAAPELYDALEDCTTRYIKAFPECIEYEPIKEALAALAKARGEV